MMQFIQRIAHPLHPRRLWARLEIFAGALAIALVDVLPFLVAPAPPLNAPNYAVRGDHCFLPEHRCVREHWQAQTLSLLAVALALGAAMIAITAYALATSVLVLLTTAVTFFYAAIVGFKLYVVSRALRAPFLSVGAERLAAIPDAWLPTYTVLVPLRDEADVMEQIVHSLRALDYPQDKLELIITVEEYDRATREAIERVGIPENWRVCVLPDTMPKTKPKAMNVAFLQARGEYVVIYDAEIIPDPDQLKKAAYFFARRPDIAVLMPRLDHYNTDHNLLTKLFTIEFTFHYDLFQPGLQAIAAPIALAGHSTHFRRAALEAAGAWDPYNVAEDCEVGIRLFRSGYRTGVLDSMSREEAASTIGSWIRQRTRWMKGFIQTSIVHLRHPRTLYREIGGLRNTLIFLATVPGTVLLNLLNLVSWTVLVAWFITGAVVIQEMFTLPVLYLANVTFIVGGFAMLYLNIIALMRRGKYHLVKWWFLKPLYWLLLAWASVRALYHLLAKPHAWEKTMHGTHLARDGSVAPVLHDERLSLVTSQSQDTNV